MEVQKYEAWIPVTAEQAADIADTQRRIGCMFFLMTFGPESALSDEEQATGWRIVTHDDHDHTYAVGWRAEKQRKEAEAQQEAEMAACPYVECTCGHHEDRY